MSSGSVVPVWVELTADIIKIYEILFSVNRLMISIQSSEVVVRTLEDKNGFAINDTKSSATLCTNQPNEVKAWTTEIKCAKLNYWKQKKEQNRPNSPISAPAPSRMDFLFRPGSSSKTSIAGPSLEETSPLAARTGFLLRAEKDRKTWNRVWSAIHNGSIWCYRAEVVSFISFLNLENTKNVKFIFYTFFVFVFNLLFFVNLYFFYYLVI